jgi:LPS sulfotransferase NodH
MKVPPGLRSQLGPVRRYVAGTLTSWEHLPRRLLVFTSGRAGSELLVSLVNSHPEILCDGEVLQRADRLPRLRPHLYVKGAASVSLRRARAGGQEPSVYGWKLASNDLRWHQHRFPDPTAFLRQAAGTDGVIVVLRRRNFVAQALSWLHAEATQYHFSKSDSEAGVRFQKMKVDPEQLLAQTWIYEFEDRWIAEITSGLDRLEFFYEDDLLEASDQQEVADRIASAFGLPPAPVQTNLRRIAPLTPAERIENIDEVRPIFAPTRFAPLLDSIGKAESRRSA